MTKRSDLITVILFCAIVASLSIAFVLMPDKLFSPVENRNLAQAPEMEKESFFSGEFAGEINEYFSDQFPLRNWFVKLQSATEILLLKGENNGVLYSNNQLAVKDFNLHVTALEVINDTDKIHEENISDQLTRINKLADKLDIPMVTVIPPRTIDIADGKFLYDRPDGDKAFELMDDILTDNVGYINVLSSLRSRYENGEYVYYRTDHHWTTLGAYYTYCDVMKQFGKEDAIIPIDEFNIETVNNFSGTTAAKGNFPIYKKDEIEIWHHENENDYIITVDGEELNGFYQMDYADTNDKYGLFLDGTHNITTVKHKSEERETLLIAKDSFANCMIPFLAAEFNIVAVDMKLNLNLSQLAEQHEADALLIVYNAENLISAGSLKPLR